MKEIFVIIALLLYAGLCLSIFPSAPSVDQYNLVAESTVAVILSLLLFYVRHARTTSHAAYSYFHAGVFFILLAAVSGVLGEVLILPFWIKILLDNIALIAGYLLLLLGVRDWLERDQHLKQRLYELSTLDDLTGFLNRRSFLERASRELSHALRYQRELIFIILDIDDFKFINDVYGHLAGDEILKQMATVVKSMLRKSEWIGRWGGEEFVFMAPESNQRGGVAVAERLRAGVENTPFKVNSKRIKLTISLGVTMLKNNEDTLHNIMERADQALYDAKKSGKNRVRWKL